MKIHIVQKGDTLWKIAKKYGVNFEELKKMNSQLSNPDMIMPGMKIKVPSISGLVKKEAPIVGTKPGVAAPLGVKKEMPILEHPFAKEQPKPLPIVEAPIKEMPIVKEVPKAPVVPKMPLPVIPEIDINNYYMMNMANMSVQQAPAPAPTPPPQPTPPPAPPAPKPVVLPEVKEVPVETCPPMEQPMYADNCVPMSPIMPGPGNICPPGYPVQPVYPYQQIPPVGMPVMPEAMSPYPGMGSEVAGTAYVPSHYSEESSSFMPAIPMNPTGNPVTQNPMGYQPIQTPYMQPAVEQIPPGTLGYPAGYPVYPEMQQSGIYPGYPSMQGGYSPIPEMPQGGVYPSYPIMPTGYPTGMPVYPGTPYFPGQYPSTMPGPGAVNPAMHPYGQMPYGYPQPGAVPQEMGMEAIHPYGAQTQPFPGPGQTLMGASQVPPAGTPNPTEFVPSTPPIYTAPYTAPMNVAQPPYMNPYGMGPLGASSYSMPRYVDESDDN
ncbi:MAG: SafA/ExsA family spore coat assembly protein [Bacillota bacterium]|nr:SafA/ExsA family spore coat assembly protein [Bacillota bacterium]